MNYHHRPARALSLLCALAIFVSLLPATLAAATEEDLNKHIVTNTVTPAGIQINLFDYWVTTRTKKDTGDSAADVTGINKDHYLRFTSSGGNGINSYTGKGAGVLSGIVNDRLEDGYPVLSTDNNNNYTYYDKVGNQKEWSTSLDYLFDQSEETETNGVKGGTLGKKTFWDVGGLLQIDNDGYYYYNADYNKSKAVGGSYQSANYAYFDEGSKTFKVYDTWGIEKRGAGDQKGQFFPFTNPSTVDVFDVDGDKLTQIDTGSNDDAINHYFGVSMTTRFIQRYGGQTAQTNGKDMTFEFSGDDDVWIFIDGILVADLGGIHDQASTSINFATGEIKVQWLNNSDKNKPAKIETTTSSLYAKMKDYYPESKNPGFWNDSNTTFADNTYHTLKLFYLERGGTDSNLAMKFNLAYVPETDGVKVDQYGHPLSGVQFDLYAAKKNADGTYTEDEETGLLASGTTDSNGRFVLNDSNSGHISLNELTRQYEVQYLILREKTDDREGYRHDDDIYLELKTNGEVSILFNDLNHRWTTGTYAGLKGAISTKNTVQLINYTQGKPTTVNNKTFIAANGEANLAVGGTLFAVIMRRLDNVGKQAPSNDDEWGVVTGSAMSGWEVYKHEDVEKGYVQAVINALTDKKLTKDNAVAFTLTTNGAYMAELDNCPGDLREYVYWDKNVDTAYTVAFYYTTESSIDNATKSNTYWVDGTGFERQFAATIYIPNVQHELNVQKIGDDNKPVEGAKFSLYAVTKNDDGTYAKSETAYDTVETDKNGKAKFPSTGHVLEEGKYYLVEDSAPAGYKVNPTAVRILVDDAHGVMADAGTATDGVTVTVSEGHLVPTMTPFATNDDIDRTLTKVTTTKKTAKSGWEYTDKLATTDEKVDLTLKSTFNANDYANSLRYTTEPYNGRDSWETDTGWLWFHIEQTPFKDTDKDANLKTDLFTKHVDLTRLFTGETTVIVTNQRVGSLSVTKVVENATKETGTPQDPNPSSYRIKITLKDKDNNLLSGTFGGLAFDKNGEYTWTAHHNETLTLSDLPIGTQWTVEEIEDLDSDNWDISVDANNNSAVTDKGASGEIKDTNQNDTVTITNRYDNYSGWEGTLSIPVSKSYNTTATGSSVYGKEVSFTLAAVAGNPEGDPLTEAKTVSITVAEGQSATNNFDALTFKTVGEYKYTVREVNGGVNGMSYDPTVYTATVTVKRDLDHPGYLKATVVWSNNVNDSDAAPSFTNTYVEPKGSLSIKKTVELAKGSAQPAAGLTFPIKITLNYTGTVQVTSTKNAQSFTWNVSSGEVISYQISAGETLTLTGLPVGTTWTVTEGDLSNADRWSTKYKVNNVDATSANGSIDKDVTKTVEIVNTYYYATNPAKAEASIKVSKSYKTSDVYNGEVSFVLKDSAGTVLQTKKISGAGNADFTLTFSEAGTYTYTVSEVDGNVKGMTYDPKVYTVTFEVKRGTGANINNLVITSTTYQVAEKAGATSETYPYLDAGLVFTNTYEPGSSEEQEKGSLTIHKTLENPKGATTGIPDNYEIKIELKDSNDAPLSGKFGILTFGRTGVVTYHIQADDTLTLRDLPVGTQWTVTETALGSHWKTAYKVDNQPVTTATGRITKEGRSVDIVNTYDPDEIISGGTGALSISKEIGKGIAATTEFDFTVAVVGASDNYSATLNGTDTTVTFENGSTAVKLKGGDTLVIKGLPAGASYTVTELNADNYNVTYDPAAPATGTIVKDEAVTCQVTNELKGGEIVPGTGSLSITKKIEGNISAGTEFGFTVTVAGASGNYSATLNGADTNDVLFSDAGIATVTLKGDETLVISGLPADANYNVEEQNAESYTVIYVNHSNKIVKDQTAICSVTNKQTGGGEDPKTEAGSLVIAKTVGDGINTSLSFNFSVALTYPDKTTGTIPVTVKANSSVTISGIPVGTDYVVAETTTGYTVTATNDKGTITVSGSTATFHNTTSGGDDGPGPGPGPNPGPNPGGDDDGGTPALNRRDHYAYIIGYPDGDVHPQGNITRAEVATIFFRLLRDPVRTQYWSQTNDYPDVAFNKWYNNAISTLTNMGIICGYPDGTFRPDAPITRAELTKIAASFFSDPRVATTYDGRFSDVKGAEWYISYLMTAIEEGLIEGYPDGSFRPDRPITRAETCTIVNRTLGRKPEKDHLLPESVMINWPDNLNRNVWYYAQMQEATNSHDYRWTSVYSEVCEQWTAKLIERDWAALERTWSHANSAPGGEVMN